MSRFVIENGLVITMERGEPVAFKATFSSTVRHSRHRTVDSSAGLRTHRRARHARLAGLRRHAPSRLADAVRGVAADWTLLDYVVEMRFVFGALYSADDAWLGN
jgi:hypothetical protein